MAEETATKPLRELVRAFSRGKILLPQFQRDYIWKPKKIRNLLDSLFRGFPVGGFYLWYPGPGEKDPKPKRLGPTIIPVEFDGYLIDGQQRLTSLEAAFDLYSGEDKGGNELRCYLDLEATDLERVRDTRMFVSYGGRRAIARRVDNGDSTLVPVAAFFEKAEYQDLRQKTEEALRLKRGWSTKDIENALKRLDRAPYMLDQLVPCTTVSEVSIKDAVEIFSRLNKGGTQLRQGDVRAAELAQSSAVSVLKQMREFVSKDRPRRLGFGFSFAFRTLVVFHRESAQFLKLKPDWIETPGPQGRSLAQSWKAAERSLNSALEFVDERMGWSHRILLPSVNGVIVLAAAMDRANHDIAPEHVQAFRRWLCLTALRSVFQGSVETTINRFIRAIKESRRHPAYALLDALRRHEGRKITPAEFNSPAQLWGPAVQVMHAWLVSCDARDWLDNDKTIAALSRATDGTAPAGELTVHHIFAREVLAKILEDTDGANRLANFALISRSTNSEFGAKRPDDVFSSLTPDQRISAAVQFFSEGAGDRLAPSRYEEFCEWRAGSLAHALNDFLAVE